MMSFKANYCCLNCRLRPCILVLESPWCLYSALISPYCILYCYILVIMIIVLDFFDVFDVLEDLAKTRGLYQVPELSYEACSIWFSKSCIMYHSGGSMLDAILCYAKVRLAESFESDIQVPSKKNIFSRIWSIISI